jgi:hypothetical protein
MRLAALAMLTAGVLSAVELPSLPRAVVGPFVGIIGTDLVVAGGELLAETTAAPLVDGGGSVLGRAFSDEVWSLSPGARAWVKIGNLPQGLAHGLAVSTPLGLVLVGGRGGSGAVPTVLQLRHEWRGVTVAKLAPLPMALEPASGVVVKDRIYVRSSKGQAWSLPLAGREAWHAEATFPGGDARVVVWGDSVVTVAGARVLAAPRTK